MTVKLGTFSNVLSLKKELRQQGVVIDTWADDILGPAFPLSVIGEVDLVSPTVAQLGFGGSPTTGVRYRELCSRAVSVGLQKCPAEVGPQVMRQHSEQIKANDTFRVAMEPILGSSGTWFGFYLQRCSRGPFLSTNYGDHYKGSYGFGLGDEIIFIKPRRG